MVKPSFACKEKKSKVFGISIYVADDVVYCEHPVPFTDDVDKVGGVAEKLASYPLPLLSFPKALASSNLYQTNGSISFPELSLKTG
eukprot:768747-Hanusia_phi.AAC.1